MNGIQTQLAFLYGTEEAPRIFARVRSLLDARRARIAARDGSLSERDSILITYGDQVRAAGEAPLKTLGAFCRESLAGVVSGIHILPFYPWTSDDGFSVADYRRVDPQLGTWDDVHALGRDFRLMFDGVINHVSAGGEWFQGFLKDDPRYREYFITVEDGVDLTQVVRPRALPLWTAFETASGPKRVWTTFSADQVDLNYRNPEVLLEVLDVLLGYVEHGADFIRLDAIAYLWKQPGSSCIHLPQTHAVVRLLRAALDEAAPFVQLITETNVPHTENLSYFGDGTDEAQLVYNFALPPLTLHAFQTGQAQALTAWAATLSTPSDRTTFFNFLASHDGIGLNPARGILPDEALDSLVGRARAHGGLVSLKSNPDGSQSPYEVNINYFDALSDPLGAEPLGRQVDRFIAAQAVMLALAGVPGLYFHSLFGSRGWPEGARRTGRSRSINRRKCDLEDLRRDLADPACLRAQVFARLRGLLAARRRTPAFHPHGGQRVLDLHAAVFGLERTSPDGRARALCLHNVSAEPVRLRAPVEAAADLLTGEPLRGPEWSLGPYQTLWVTP